MTEARATLRRELRARRAALDGTARFHAARAVAELLESIPGFAAAKRIAGYWAVAGELPLSMVVPAIDRNPEQSFYLPVLPESRSGPLEFAPWRVGEPVAANLFGIPESQSASRVEGSALDVVLLPTVGFDRRGHRLGTGGGYYDRTFAFRQHAEPPPLLIGVAFACQEINAGDSAEWDVDLDWVVTEREAIKCAPRTQARPR